MTAGTDVSVRAYIGLGSNLSAPTAQLHAAVQAQAAIPA